MIIFLKQFIRNFYNNKQSSILSIGGLSIGIATTLVIGWWCINEFSYDSFHKDKDAIYRLCRAGYINNESIKLGSIYAPETVTFKDKFPEIVDAVRVVDQGVSNIEANHIAGKDIVFLADSNFFSFFSYDLVVGDINTCLSSPTSIVVSEQVKKKYFQHKDCIGKVIHYNDKDWTISAVMKNIPANSHLQFDMLTSIEGSSLKNNGWGNTDSFLSYLKLAPNANQTHLKEEMLKILHQAIPQFKEIDMHYAFQALTNIYFDTAGFRFDSVKKGDKRLTLILGFMALAILTIACINFTNLFISNSFLRAKSIAIKKSNGANKLHLVLELFTETSLYILISLIIGLALAINAVPVFNNLVDSQVTFNLLNPKLYAFLGTVGIITALLAGAFPAISLSQINIVTALKGNNSAKGVSGFQKSLVVIQFAASIVLLITMVAIKKQVYYMQHIDLGFNKDNVIYVDANKGISEHYNSFKQELEKSPYIKEVTSKSCIPSQWQNGNSVSLPGSSNESYIVEICQIKPNYLDMFQFELIKGEPLSTQTETKNAIWINESTAHILGLNHPIGKTIIVGNEKEPQVIRGVLADAKTKSLHSKADPQVYFSTENVKSWYSILIKTTGNQNKAIETIKQQWLALNPNEEFTFNFLDDTYNQLYEHETKSGKMVTWGMVIALFITTIGLIAMANYATQRRKKEIGVRKVNGAKSQELVWMLIKSFLLWVIIALVIASPISYFIVTGWLSNFAYRTDLSWWIFALSGLFTLSIALLTVGWQSWKAANGNPVNALKCE
jgi:putative ABC transport system permease protein